MLESRVWGMEDNLGTSFSANRPTERLAKGVGYMWNTSQPQRFSGTDYGCLCTYVQSRNNTQYFHTILSSRMIEDCGKRGNTMAERRQLFAEMRKYFLEMFCCDRLLSQLQCSVRRIYASFPPQVTGISISQVV